LVIDRVEYSIGWSFFGMLAQAAFVRRTLEDNFDYRRQRVAELLEGACVPDHSTSTVSACS
jgi:hypothetical protein